MLTIRLSRTGKRNKPQYRIVLQEKGRDPWSPAIEILGTYNPHTSPSTIKLEEERITYWLSKGAQPSNTVHNMLVNADLIKADKVKSVSISKKRSKKLEEKAAEATEKKAEAKVKAKEEAESKDEQPSSPPAEEPATKEASVETPAEEPAQAEETPAK